MSGIVGCSGYSANDQLQPITVTLYCRRTVYRTMQDREFSQPQPSPSESLSADSQKMVPAVFVPPVFVLPEFVPPLLGADVLSTRQLAFCSKPNPSPSGSLAALWQTGRPGADGVG